MEHILLLHGALGSAASFDSLREALKPTVTVHTLDFSGHGGKTLPASGFYISLFATDVLDYIAQQTLPAVHIFGYSMGGYVGLYLANHYPDKVKSVFTLATKFDWTPDTAEKELKLLDPDKIKEKIPHFAKSLHERHHPQRWEDVMQSTASMMQQLGEDPALSEEALKQIKVPVQIGVGDADSMVSLDETIQAYRFIPHARLIVFPATKHPFEHVSTPRLQQEIQFFINVL